MRIVASACLVLAIVFMVGCGTTQEEKTAIKSATDKITALETAKAGMDKTVGDIAKKITDIETYLKSKDPKYGVPPDTMKKPEPPKGGKPAGKEEPKPKEEPKGKAPVKKDAGGKTK